VVTWMSRIMPFMFLLGISAGVPGASLSEDAGSSAAQESLTVTGVIEQLDLSSHKGLLKTSTGKPVFFEIVKPELFKGMTIGQRVTLQLDEHGRAVKAIETQSIPELPAPAQ
jgi:hypothetical protein